ncbi:MAG: phosphatase [Bacteroidota bacterium]
MADFSKDIELLFSERGGIFKSSSSEIQNKLFNIKALLFDWDGVFNNGVKNGAEGSLFSEVDSMGINMLRFSYYLKYGVILPVFIITGENNQPALRLSDREHFNGVYIKMPQKLNAIDHLAQNFSIHHSDIGFIFDDVLDLGVADIVSLRFFVKRESNPLLNDLIENQSLAEYYTFNSGATNAVREICELSIGLIGNYTDTINQRKEFSPLYKAYLTARNAIVTKKFRGNKGVIEPISL